MKSGTSIQPDPVPYNTNNKDDMRALDQSEKEYNRMLSQHTTYHRMLMDDLMKLSSESGSGSNGTGPRALLQQQINQANQANVVTGLATTIGNLNTSNQGLMSSASKFVNETDTSAKRVSRLNNFIQQNASKLGQDMDEYQAIASQYKVKEGFDNLAPTMGTNPTMDAALEVSTTVRESQKYALVIFGIFATYALYKTIKHL